MSTPYKITRDKYLTDDEQEELTAKLGPWTTDPAKRRDAALIFLGMFTGARAREILNVRYCDVTLYPQPRIYIRGLKGSDDRNMPIPEWLVDLAAPIHERGGVNGKVYWYKTNEEQQEPIFKISYSRLVQIWNEVRPGNKSFKSLRHTFAIQVYSQTKDLFLTQRALGHRSIGNTLVYVEFLQRTMNLGAVAKLDLYHHKGEK